MKSYIKSIVLLATLVLAVLIARDLLLNRAKVVNLNNGPIYPAISASIQSPIHGSYIPIEGKDYVITSIHYLDNKTWAVVNVGPVNNNAQAQVILLHQSRNTYITALGPGQGFSSSEVNGLPTDIANYLKTQGLVLEGASNG